MCSVGPRHGVTSGWEEVWPVKIASTPELELRKQFSCMRIMQPSIFRSTVLWHRVSPQSVAYYEVDTELHLLNYDADGLVIVEDEATSTSAKYPQPKKEVGVWVNGTSHRNGGTDRVGSVICGSVCACFGESSDGREETGGVRELLEFRDTLSDLDFVDGFIWMLDTVRVVQLQVSKDWTVELGLESRFFGGASFVSRWMALLQRCELRIQEDFLVFYLDMNLMVEGGGLLGKREARGTAYCR
ncbi:hypothetical protein AXG93_3493s1020 [Marchantia polymorpha subsp. ruderalis]|uniref:Uncharacterized protein n=1 Tax=Marchantia polymorpha subsp. ruderalis TaxID=1480154 RepID=A0A176WST4_MARPO|nr:hypothetical protein AXG93_3493s1020 [Marchantia polymorpha subsp. ruderalis]